LPAVPAHSYLSGRADFTGQMDRLHRVPFPNFAGGPPMASMAAALNSGRHGLTTTLILG